MLTLGEPRADCEIPPWPEPYTEYGSALGSWGDCMIAAGTMAARLGRGGLIVWTMQPGVSEFLARQPWIADVRTVTPAHDEQYRLIIQQTSLIPRGFTVNEDGTDSTMDGLARAAGIAPARLHRTHIDREQWLHGAVHHWPSAAVLRREAVQWALDTEAEIGAPFLLVQPFSFQSCEAADHWPHWQGLVNWLATENYGRIALIGHGWQPQGQTERVVDLVGRAPSMEHVFALATRARLVVTTCNSLAHFCAIQRLPAVVCCNVATSEPSSYFARWMDAPATRKVLHHEPLHAAVVAVRGHLGEI